MGHSNYKLTDEQKELLVGYTKALVAHIEGELSLDIVNNNDAIDPYDSKGKFDNNKFTAIVWYIGEQLSVY